jgi:iron(III) transport system substrate-binding protein
MKRRQFLAAGAAQVLVNGCAPRSPRRVVLLCSVDDVYARPILKEVEARTGVAIDAVFDVEAAKTAGLANRIRAERARPRSDIFWSSALLQTLLLQREGLLQSYNSPSARDIPQAFRDEGGFWAAVGTRHRVIVHHESLRNPPSTLHDLLQSRLKNRVAISNPQFGTATDWAAALGTRWGVEKTLAFFRALQKNGVQVLAGNSVVAERVASGEMLAGVTDTDDFFARHAQNPSLRLSVPARPYDIHRVSVPGSVAILRGAPRLKNAKIVLDALLESRTEQMLSSVMKGASLSRDAKETVADDSSRWVGSWQKLRDPVFEILNA